ncbi:MAG: hypothetical protein H0T79_01340 [Deltaproteobacteria bacterium]|nr:hypothetical protein [Deltaproteobacteria bacterium]
MVVVAGCFDPVGLTDVPCSAQGRCPGGLACVEGVCGGDPTPPPTPVTARFGYRVIDVVDNDNGYAMTEQLDDPEVLRPEVTLDDQRVLDITFAPDRSFTFDAPTGDAYHVRTTAVDVRSSAAPALSMLSPFYGRTDRMPVTQRTPLEFNLSADTPSSGGFLYSTGSRAAIGVTIAPLVTVDRRAMMSIGPLGLLDAERGDRLYLVRTAVDNQNKYSYAASVLRAAVTQRDGVTSIVQGGLTPLPRDRCARVRTNRADELARLSAQYQGVASSVWTILSTPLAAHGPFGSMAIVVGAQEPANDSLDVRYSAPLPAEDHLIGFLVTIPQKIATKDGELDVANGVVHLAPLASGGNCPNATITADIPLPHSPVLGGTALTPRTVIELDRSAPVTLTLSQTDGAVELYVATLYEVEKAQVTGMTARHVYVATTPELAIDPDDLVAGREYLFAIETRRGHPGVASGDFSTMTYPYSRAFVYSSAFFIAN